jgi:hypothetical protein
MLETITLLSLPLLQILIALGLINVWVFRFARATEYRGAGAKNMKEEFAVYGLPSWFLYVVGLSKEQAIATGFSYHLVNLAFTIIMALLGFSIIAMTKMSHHNSKL